MPVSITRSRSQTVIALVSVLILEALFAAMASFGDLKLNVIGTIVLALAAGVVYFVALYALEHSLESRAALWLILAGALLFRITLAPLPPSLSTDLYRYRWDARVQLDGWNPYVVAPLDPRLAYLRDPGWAVMPAPETPTMYPPLAELIFRSAERWVSRPLVRWTGGRISGPVAFKLPFVLVDLLVVAMLAGWLKRSGGKNYQLAIYAWNPLVVVELAASGHCDVFAIAAMVAALAIIKRRPAMSTLTLMAGALGKLFPVTLLPLAARLSGWPGRLRGWLACAACALLGAVCLWPYRSAYSDFAKIFTYYQATWQNYNPSLYGIFLWFTGRPEIAAGIGEGIVLGIALWAAARKIEPLRAAFLIVGAILMVAPNTYSWYFTWIVPLLCFFPNPAWLLLTILQFISYKILIDYRILGVWRYDPFFQWLTYAPFYAFLVGRWLIQPRPDSALQPAPAAASLQSGSR